MAGKNNEFGRRAEGTGKKGGGALESGGWDNGKRLTPLAR
jgi:hypothetical protein